MTRRHGNGEGGITRHEKSGLYMARYMVRTATDPKRETVYGKTRKEAAEKLTKAMADRDGGLVFDPRIKRSVSIFSGGSMGPYAGASSRQPLRTDRKSVV